MSKFKVFLYGTLSGIVEPIIDPNKFQDLPGIIMPSLGLAMIGVIGIVAYII